MGSCDRCGDYAYHPVKLAAITGEYRRMGDGIVLFDGWDGFNVLCRECAKELDDWMDP